MLTGHEKHGGEGWGFGGHREGETGYCDRHLWKFSVVAGIEKMCGGGRRERLGGGGKHRGETG